MAGIYAFKDHFLIQRSCHDLLFGLLEIQNKLDPTTFKLFDTAPSPFNDSVELIPLVTIG
jgi:hypothetical protein